MRPSWTQRVSNFTHTQAGHELAHDEYHNSTAVLLHTDRVRESERNLFPLLHKEQKRQKGKREKEEPSERDSVSTPTTVLGPLL